MAESQATILDRLDRAGRCLENTLLCLLLGLMIVVGAMQIVQRNFFDTSFIWSDELLRLLVLWLSLIGAVAASREDRHIAIDLFSRFLSQKKNLVVRLVVDLFTVIVCAVLAWSGTRFVALEREFGSTVLNGQPAWVLQVVIPLTFGLIAYRYLVFFLRHIGQLKGMRGET
ncbi:MAG: TRAP transporter small permease [Desulfuromonadales bacterium]|nr:TRAP transporter small permease [Desulfuromonadales bacterium]